MASPRLRDALLVALLILGWAGRAGAEPIGPHLYAESSLRIGHVWGESRAANGYVADRDTGLVDVRFSLGGVLGRRQGTNFRLGAVVDTGWASVGGAGVALGVEAQVDRDLDARWRLGGRVSGSLGSGGALEGQILMAGLRLHNEVVVVDLDVLSTRSASYGDRAHGTGVLVGAGVVGRPAGYAIAISAGATVVGALVLFALMGQVTTH